MTDLQKFLMSIGNGLEESPYKAELRKIDELIDARLDARIREVASELSGVFIEKIADLLEERGLALDGHKIVTGYSGQAETKSSENV